MLKLITATASASEATFTAPTPSALPHKRVYHVATDLATEARSFENICNSVQSTQKRDTRFFPEDEISATICYDAIPTSHIIVSTVSTTSPPSITSDFLGRVRPCSFYVDDRMYTLSLSVTETLTLALVLFHPSPTTIECTSYHQHRSCKGPLSRENLR